MSRLYYENLTFVHRFYSRSSFYDALYRLIPGHAPKDSYQGREEALYQAYREIMHSFRDLTPRELRDFIPGVLRTLARGEIERFGSVQLEAAWFSRRESGGDMGAWFWQEADGDMEVPTPWLLAKCCRGLLEVVMDEDRTAEDGGVHLRLTQNSFRDFLLDRPRDPCLGHWYDIMRGELQIAKSKR